MRVVQIRISNIMGVEQIEFEPGGALTMVEGGNEVGKTSVLEAIRSVMENAPTAELLRKGADKGEVVLVFEDGTAVRRTFTEGAKSGALQVKHPEFGNVGRPQTYMDKLVGALNANPIAFVHADERTRTKLLLEALPAQVTQQEIEEAVGGMNVGDVDENAHALQEIERLVEWIYNARREQNTVAKEKGTLVEQLRETLPKGFTDEPTDYPKLIGELEAKKNGLRHSTRQEVEGIRADYKERADAKLGDLSERKERLKAQIEELRSQVAKISEQEKDISVEYNRAMEAEIATLQRTADAAEAEISNRIKDLHDRARSETAAQRTAEILKTAEAERDKAAARSEKCTAALEGLAALTQKKIAEANLNGVALKEGKIYFRGVEFSRLNTATQYQLAIQVAVRKAGKLPFICVDGIEALDEKSFNILATEVAKAGVQAITARVTAGPLTVRAL